MQRANGTNLYEAFISRNKLVHSNVHEVHYLGIMMRKILHPFESKDQQRKELEEIEKFEYVHTRDKDEALLAGNLGVKPTAKAGETLSLFVTEKMFSHTKITDFADKITEKILPADKLKTSWKVTPGAEGKSSPVAKDKLLILDDSGEKPVVMIVRHVHISVRSYDIFSVDPVRPGQKPSSRQKYEKKPLYHLGKVKFSEEEKEYAMEMYSGKGAYEDDAFTMVEVPSGKMFGEEVVLVRRAQKAAATLRRGRFPEEVVAPAWEGTVAPGIDPLIITCLAAIYDDQQL